MADDKPNDYPFYDVVRQAIDEMAKGHEVFQKFTCQHCGSRQTMETPNVFYESGTCEECKGLTNIRLRGCNFLLVIKTPRRAAQ